MKYVIILLVSVSLSYTLYATENSQISISKLVKEIKHSTSQDKRLLMNKLKIALRNMNIKTRQKVMKDLQKSFASHSTKTSKTTMSQVPSHSYSSQHHTTHKGQIPNNPTRQRPTPIRQTPAPTPTRQTPMRPNIPRNIPQGGPR